MNGHRVQLLLVPSGMDREHYACNCMLLYMGERRVVELSDLHQLWHCMGAASLNG